MSQTLTLVRGSNRLGASLPLRPHALSAAVVGILTLASAAQVAANETVVPENARPMTGVELYMLYHDKSWQWPDGAARMHDNGRTFKAWSGSGPDASWATGRWIVTDTGRLCLKADWHTRAGTFDGKTCFAHRTDGQAIYQRKEPDGDWYVFRHEEPQEGGEPNILVRDDLVTAKLEALQDAAQQPDTENASVVRQPQDSDAKGEIR
ncbi:DUF995 domain-containing protein [Chelativorans alearense]|uniref:DUF995 domain-containing protein n=1 Tax=Chelativorans alearense TaxID=2681495 RepID=UPI0013D7BC80|nr:DUF995 domain-containing protein [Chelativorans alearense]